MGNYKKISFLFPFSNSSLYYLIFSLGSFKLEWLRSKSLQAINAGEGVEKREPSYTVGGNAN